MTYHKGRRCPYSAIKVCREGYCSDCEVYAVFQGAGGRVAVWDMGEPSTKSVITRKARFIAWAAGLLGLMTRQCDSCGKINGFKRGYGVTGLSHGPCRACAKRLYNINIDKIGDD